MKKKIIKGVFVAIVLMIAILMAAPFFLEAKIGDILKNNVNNSVNATLDFSKADLSLIKSFPSAAVSLQDVVFINKAPFAGDTLFSAKEVSLKMGIMQLFKGAGTPISITRFAVHKPLLGIKVDADGNANYDIAIENTADTAEPGPTNDFTFNMQSYEITDAKISYDDYATGIHLEVLEMHHKGKGDLSLGVSELDTHTSASISLEMDSTGYLNKNKIKLDALIGIDLKENKYTFLKNEALVNQLPLVFDGFVKINETGQQVDVKFKTPSSDFKNFLGLVPAQYSKNIENVKTTGNFTISGVLAGTVDDTHIPTFDIKINSDNASFKYPDLPKSVRNVFIDTEIQNKSGIVEDTYVDIRKLSFMIDEDKFNMSSKITELLGNTKVSAHIDGKMNLANISKAYPVPTDLDLKGLLSADISTVFDMLSIEKKQYEKTRTQGKLNITDFEYASTETPAPVLINALAMDFTPGTVNLGQLSGKTGKTDFNVTGAINNVLGFMFNDEKIKGNFNLKSDVFALNDFMVADDGETMMENTEYSAKDNTEEQRGETATTQEKIKIPSFLDANINASANTVLYDNLSLKNLKGVLRIKDETAELSNMTFSLFDGKVAFNGQVSTKQDVPDFNMNLGLDQLQIGETFKALELFKALAPVAQIIKGKMSSNIELSGNLKDDFTPDLLSLTGNVLANILTREISAEKSPILSALDGKLDFIDLKGLNLKELKTKLAFKNGLVSVKPFTVNYKDIAINVAGEHTFDQNMKYKATLEVPAKYLGAEVNGLIAKIDEDQLGDVTVPVTATIGGAYKNPQVTTDLTSGVKGLTSKLIEIQKQKLINSGKDKVKDLLGNVLSGAGPKDTIKKDNTVKNVLGGILGNNKKDAAKVKDTEATPKSGSATEEVAKKVFGGLFGKKKDTVKKKKN